MSINPHVIAHSKMRWSRALMFFFVFCDNSPAVRGLGSLQPLLDLERLRRHLVEALIAPALDQAFDVGAVGRRGALTRRHILLDVALRQMPKVDATNAVANLLPHLIGALLCGRLRGAFAHVREGDGPLTGRSVGVDFAPAE